MDIKQKIRNLVKRGYTQGAFRNISNARYFKSLWEEKGYNVGYIRSSGAVVEGGYKHNAYYMIAEKKRKIKRKLASRRLASQRKQKIQIKPYEQKIVDMFKF